MVEHWIEIDNQLIRKFEFEDFMQALGFVNVIGELAEAENHHPNILLHDYKHVMLAVTTHDQGNTITQKDRLFAEKVNGLMKRD